MLQERRKVSVLWRRVHVCVLADPWVCRDLGADCHEATAQINVCLSEESWTLGVRWKKEGQDAEEGWRGLVVAARGSGGSFTPVL